MFDMNVTTTPIASPIYSQTYFESPKTPTAFLDRRAHVGPSKGIRNNDWQFLRSSPGTATVSEIIETKSGRRAGESTQSPTEIHSTSDSNRIEKMRDDRVLLLAQKYAGGLNAENSARLEILTERLNQLNQRVTPVVIERVNNIVERIELANSRLEILKNKYRIEA